MWSVGGNLPQEFFLFSSKVGEVETEEGGRMAGGGRTHQKRWSVCVFG